MLKSFYGCCPLRNGVGVIAIFNFIWTAFKIIYHFIYITTPASYYIGFQIFENYPVTNDNDTLEKSSEKSKIMANFMKMADFNEMQPSHGNNEYNVSYTNDFTGIFLDYVFLVAIGWIFLEIVVNVDLKKSTFAHAPHKIYAWLIVYGANVTFMLILVTYYSLRVNNLMSTIGFILYTSIIALELLAVYSYYKQEIKTATSNFVQLKWQYISKGRVLSKGTDYATASTFAAEMSNLSRIGKTTPYVINIQQ